MDRKCTAVWTLFSLSLATILCLAHKESWASPNEKKTPPASANLQANPQSDGSVVFRDLTKETNLDRITNSIEFRAIAGSLRIFLPPFAKIGREESKHKQANQLRFQNGIPEVRLPKSSIESRCSLNLKEFRRMISMVPDPDKTADEQRPFFPFDAKIRFKTECDYSGITKITRGIISVEHAIKDFNPYYRLQYRLRFSAVRDRKTKSRFIRVEVMDGELYHGKNPMTPQMTFAGTIAFRVNSFWELSKIEKSEIFVYFLQGTKIEKIVPIEIRDNQSV